MKTAKKKKVVLLGVSVLLVWGMALYRIVTHASLHPDRPVVHVPAQQDPSFVPDSVSFELLLTYDDPFLPARPRSRPLAKRSLQPRPKMKTVTPPPGKVKIPTNLKYHGTIRTRDRRTVALLSHNGKYIKLHQNQQLDQIKLLSLGKDSVEISYRKTRFYVKKEQPQPPLPSQSNVAAVDRQED